MKKIVLLTTGQPATNPRLVKEADSLVAAGYEVTVIYCYYIAWAAKFEKMFLPKTLWEAKCVGGCPENKKLLYVMTKLRYKLSRFINLRFSEKIFTERAEARAYDEMLKAAKKTKADLYIAHNLGALPAAVKAAKFQKAKAGFDFEDYHRGEHNLDDHNRKRAAWLENKYLSHLSYYSSSSPLIANAVNKDHPHFSGRKLILLNCFSKAAQPPFQSKKLGDETLRLFWFSQTVGRNRGLETVVAALKTLNDHNIHLTLAGRCDEEMTTYIKANAGPALPNIHFAGIIHPFDLPAFSSKFDVGLATEIDQPVNRSLCLTNKLFTYLLAGNAILASDTKAQHRFMNENKNIGLVYEQNNANCLAEKIKMYKDDFALLSQHRKNAYAAAANKYNWELESQKLIDNCKLLLS